MDVNNPLVTDGWSSLRVFYKLEHIHQILLKYVDNSTSQITVFSSISAISNTMKFLTNIHRMRTKHLFRVKLTKSQSKASHLLNNVLLYCFFVCYFVDISCYLFFCLFFIYFFRTYQLTLQLTFGNIYLRGWNCRDRRTHALFSVSFWCVIHLRSQLRLGRDGRTFAYSIG